MSPVGRGGTAECSSSVTCLAFSTLLAWVQDLQTRVLMRMRHSHWYTVLARSVVLLLVGGCASAIETARVSDRFEAIFHCPPASIEPESEGYRVEGCGRVAHFHCFAVDGDDEFEDHRLGEAIMESIIEGALVPETCILEHTEMVAHPVLSPESALVAAAPVDPSAVVSSRLLVRGGYLAVLGRASRNRRRALLRLRSAAPLAAAPCDVTLRRDGSTIPVRGTLRANDYEVLILIDSRDLRDLGHAEEFAGNACGFAFELDASGRQELGDFEARFRKTSAPRDTAAPTDEGFTPFAPQRTMARSVPKVRADGPPDNQ